VGGLEALEPEEGEQPPVPVPPHAGVLRAAVAGELAVAATRREQHLAAQHL